MSFGPFGLRAVLDLVSAASSSHHVLSRLDTLAFLHANVAHGWFHSTNPTEQLGRNFVGLTAYDKVVYVVIVYDVGDVALRFRLGLSRFVGQICQILLVLFLLRLDRFPWFEGLCIFFLKIDDLVDF